MKPLALALLTAAALAPLFGQTPNPPLASAQTDPIMLEAFVSTGARFSDRTVTESPVPIDMVVNTELRQGGYTETS